ncbi:hypothetical protein U5640_00835 [Streptomyces sp. SS7]|uniref:hypothetical protein n=1 Tax=Streptomyces sp. SS7 TaxID=3108485 RepID=UPI0030EDDEE9
MLRHPLAEAEPAIRTARRTGTVDVRDPPVPEAHHVVDREPDARAAAQQDRRITALAQQGVDGRGLVPARRDRAAQRFVAASCRRGVEMLDEIAVERLLELEDDAEDP